MVTTRVPWAEGRSRYTAAFESLAIGWLREAGVLAVSRRLRLSWTAVDGIMERAVRRGLARRETRAVRRLSVDERSFKQGHRYVTVVSDSDTKAVLHVAPGRSREALEAFCRKVGKRQLAAVESVSMDMWRPYVAATEAWVAGARRKTAFDRFHVAKHLGDAVDKVRRAEHKELQAAGNAVLAGTRWQWLRGARKKTHGEKLAFAELRRPHPSLQRPVPRLPQPGPLRHLRMVSLGVPKARRPPLRRGPHGFQLACRDMAPDAARSGLGRRDGSSLVGRVDPVGHRSGGLSSGGPVIGIPRGRPSARPESAPGSVRSMLALLIVGAFVVVAIFGAEAFEGEDYQHVITILGTLAGPILGFYFGSRNSQSRLNPGPSPPSGQAAPRPDSAGESRGTSG